MIRRAVAALCLCACEPARAPIAACTDDLRGVYVVEGRRWMILDQRATLEAYPLFDDVAPVPSVPDLEVAPRVIDLRRTPDSLAGTVTRRYLRGGDRCDARAPVRVTACAGDGLELVLAEPVPPLGFAPCTWGETAASRREKWARE